MPYSYTWGGSEILENQKGRRKKFVATEMPVNNRDGMGEEGWKKKGREEGGNQNLG